MALKSKKILSDYGEFGVIDLIKKHTSLSSSIIQGIGDDTAVLPYKKDQYLLLTTDMLIQGVHFTKYMSARGIGHKALACSISDIAAMGGRPKYAVVSLGVPKNLKADFVRRLYQGMQKVATAFGVDIVGGDTVKNDKIIINVALIGEVDKKNLVCRHGAQISDQIFVTGPLGKSYATGHHLKFIPRVKEARALVKSFRPTSMIDISDGLAADLGHILEGSQVGAVLFEEDIPRRRKASLKEALGDGEDFELLFTLSAKESKQCSFYHIGEIVKGGTLTVVDKKGKSSVLKSKKGYQHF